MRVGIKSGSFVLLTPGHVECFRFCKSHCDYLIVLNNHDEFIMKKKGCVPIPENDRIKILESIKYIDEVHLFHGYTEDYWVWNFKTNDLYKNFGANAKLIMFHSPEVVNNPPCKSFVDEIVYVPKVGNISTTGIFETIRGDGRLRNE